LRQGTNHEEHLNRIVDFVPGSVDWLHGIDDLPFAGNINKGRIFRFVKDIDYRFVPPPASFGGNDLDIIKTTRNDLAHGAESFFDIGSNYTTNDIIQIFTRIRTFILAFLRVIDKYRSDQHYLR
jgi:hypothetical protein